MIRYNTVRQGFILKILLGIILISAAACGGRRPIPRDSQNRAIDALAGNVDSDIITAGRFRSVCDLLARNLIAQDFVSRAPRQPIITIRKLENKTGLTIDESIFQETIRARLMENAGGMVLFRDDVSYRDILQERMRQSDNEVTLSLTDSVVNTHARDKYGEQVSDRGFLSATGGTDEKTDSVEEQSEMHIEQTGTVKGRIAPADYFLRGIIYQIKEQNVNDRTRGTTYFQYQFRIVDARSGIIVWEKMLDSKMAGTFAPTERWQNPNQQQPGFGQPFQPNQPGTDNPAQAYPGQAYPGQQGYPAQQGSPGNWPAVQQYNQQQFVPGQQ